MEQTYLEINTQSYEPPSIKIHCGLWSRFHPQISIIKAEVLRFSGIGKYNMQTKSLLIPLALPDPSFRD